MKVTLDSIVQATVPFINVRRASECMKHRLTACVARYGSRKTFAYSSGSRESLARQEGAALNIRYTQLPAMDHSRYCVDIIAPANYTALI